MPTPLEIQTCIDNIVANTAPVDFTVLAAETSSANVGISFAVETVNDLPDLSLEPYEGQIIFVNSISVPVVATKNEWRGLDGRLLRSDETVRSLYVMGCLTAAGPETDRGALTLSYTPVQEISKSKDWCYVTASRSGGSGVKTSGQLWTWGFACVLGDGTTIGKTSPVREFCSATDWIMSAIGNNTSHALGVKSSGEIWAWGTGSALGNGLSNGFSACKFSPVREFCSATDWCYVAAGESVSFGVKTSGQLWSWGAATGGRIGDGTTVSKCSPVREFCSATNWCQVSSGGCHTVAVKTDGSLWGWGCNGVGRIGDGTTVTSCSPVREFCSATDWEYVSAGCSHSVAIKTDGSIWSWGNGGEYRLGTCTTTSSCSAVREFCSATNWCLVRTQGDHGLAIKTDGSLWGWGRNLSGAISGVGVGCECCFRKIPTKLDNSNEWCTVAGGYLHSLAIKVT